MAHLSPVSYTHLKQNSPLFRLLTQIQDEVHRFAITFHRDKRSKRQVASALDEIKAVSYTHLDVYKRQIYMYLNYLASRQKYDKSIETMKSYL